MAEIPADGMAAGMRLRVYRYYWPLRNGDDRREAAGARLPITSAMPQFAAIVARIKSEHDIRVRRWRKQMTGCAWQERYGDGTIIRYIEAPHPRSPISLAVFLHEVGHHVIGFSRYRRRCEEEYHVWRWALETMRRVGVEPDEKVMRRFELSMRYAVGKALRRGVRELPGELMEFAPAA